MDEDSVWNSVISDLKSNAFDIEEITEKGFQNFLEAKYDSTKVKQIMDISQKKKIDFAVNLGSKNCRFF